MSFAWRSRIHNTRSLGKSYHTSSVDILLEQGASSSDVHVHGSALDAAVAGHDHDVGVGGEDINESREVLVADLHGMEVGL